MVHLGTLPNEEHSLQRPAFRVALLASPVLERQQGCWLQAWALMKVHFRWRGALLKLGACGLLGTCPFLQLDVSDPRLSWPAEDMFREKQRDRDVGKNEERNVSSQSLMSRKMWVVRL